MSQESPTIYISRPDRIGPPFKVITLLGSATQGFPSGLIRYDRTYLVEKKNVEAAREIFQIGNPLGIGVDTEFGVDAPYIFPDPREVNDIPGFTKFIVTAYARGRDVQFRETFNQQQINLSKGFSESVFVTPNDPPVNYAWSVLEKYLVDSVTTSGVAPSEVDSYLGSARILRVQLIRRIVSGEVAPNGARQLNINWAKETVSVVRRNFGRWTEYDHTQTLIPYY